MRLLRVGATSPMEAAMATGTEDIRWRQRFANYNKALAQLRKFIEKGDLSELEKQGLIKAFEYTFELAWTTMKDFLEFRGQTDIFGSRDAIRKSFQLGLIADGGRWMDMLTSRNQTSHTYNEAVAEEICRAVQAVYYPLFQELQRRLEAIPAEDAGSDPESKT